MGRNGSSNRYCLIESIYQEAVELPSGRRGVLLDSRCGRDRTLRAEIESLLEHHDVAAEGYLTKPVHQLGSVVHDHDTVPDRIGEYKIVRLIGRGGMGTVYEAEQAQPRRRVAIKMVHHGGLSGDALRRFRHEADVLGRLQHPGIAHIHEFGVAGVVVAGVETHRRPFFAMEYVAGRPLREFVLERQLSLPDKLALFIHLCDAVQHAHQKGIIHRDLKPANILVSNDQRPCVLDFGVARMIGGARGESLTRAGQVVGTPAYMSPEQIAGDGHELDTRSDIYSLGVVLYELLTGELPLDCRDCSLTDAARIIRDEKPRALSETDRTLRGDLETIVAKALAKAPSRRYQSAGELAADIRRHLRGEVIDAKRDSTLYVFRKMLFRYRWPLIALHGFMLLLAAFTIYGMSQAQRYRELASRERRASHAAAAAERSADQQRQQAESQAERADAVKAFLQMMLVAADPKQARARDVTVRDVLDDAARRLKSGALADQPDAEVEIRETIARTYNHLGKYLAAAPHYEWLGSAYARRFGKSHVRTKRMLLEVAKNYSQAEDFERAKQIYERCLELPIADSEDPELTLAATDGLGSALANLGQAEQAESMYLEAMQGVRQKLGDEHELLVDTSLNLGDAYIGEGRLEDAERLYLRALALAEKIYGKNSYSSIRIRRQLAYFVYRQTNRLEEAEDMLRESLELAREELGDEHTETIIVLNWYSRVLRARGKVDQAERVLRDAIERFSGIRAIENHDTLKVVYELAVVLAARGKYEESARVLADGIDQAVAAHGDLHRPLANMVYYQAQLLGESGGIGDYAGALAAAQRSLDIRLRLFGPNHEDVAYSLQAVGWFLNTLGHYAEAVDMFRKTLELRERISGPTHRETIRTTITLAFTLLRLDHPNVDEPAALLRERYALVRNEYGDAHDNTQWVARYFGSVLSQIGLNEEAIALARATLEAVVAEYGGDSRNAAAWHDHLARSLYYAGSAEDAIAEYQRALSIYRAREQSVSTAPTATMQRLADALIAAGRADESLPLIRRARDLLAQKPRPHPLDIALMKNTHGHALLAAGKPEQAAALLSECVREVDDGRLRKTLIDMLGGEARSLLGQCLVAQRRYPEAEPLLLEGYHMLHRIRRVVRLRFAAARSRLVDFYDARGKPASADQWRGN